MDKIKHIIELSKLTCKMAERGATKDELSNVIEFFKAAIDTELECDSIYEFELINKYHSKYYK